MLKSGAYGAGVACGRVLVAYGSSYLHGKRYPAEERRGVAGEALRDGAEAVGNTLSLGLGIRKIDDGAEWQVDIVHPRQLGQAVSIGNGRRLFHENQHAHVGTVECPAHEIAGAGGAVDRSEEHTSELQSRGHLVCRLLLEKKKK